MSSLPEALWCTIDWDLIELMMSGMTYFEHQTSEVTGRCYLCVLSPVQNILCLDGPEIWFKVLNNVVLSMKYYVQSLIAK